MKSPLPLLSRFRRRGGIALVIVLAFVVLLTGLVIAFFTQAMNERQISNSSASQTRVALYAQGAADTIIGDLKQEIVAGSSPTPADNSKVYYPTTPSKMVPERVGLTTAAQVALPNLVKRSASGVAVYTGGPTRAATAPSTTASKNGRTVSLARWNSPLLLPKRTPTSDTDYTPDTNFVAPDWIYTARDGSNPTSFVTGSGNPGSANKSFVVGRYAYAVYDEGGLLDVNAAGFPSGATDAQKANKGSLAMADLPLLLSLVPSTPPLPLATRNKVVDALVGWRNYASAAVDLTASTPTPVPLGGSFPGYTFSDQQVKNYFTSVLNERRGFMTVSNEMVVSQQSDRKFTNRQDLMKLLLRGVAGQTAGDASERAGIQNSLQYLSTFTRDINQPSFRPATFADPTGAPKVLQDGSKKFGGNTAFGKDKDYNPSFLETRVTHSFTRNDGTNAAIGDPLVGERFALNRLAWVTFKGPSATVLSDNNIIAPLKAAGMTQAFLEQGTAANVYKYFGLTWDTSQHRWVYDHHSATPPGSAPTPAITGAAADNTLIYNLGQVRDLTPSRDPDFFELLKAGINAGSLGKHGSLPCLLATASKATGIQYLRDINVDFHLMKIGANIIDQFDADNYPTRILVANPLNTALPREITGTENLPYVYRIRNGILRLTEVAGGTPTINASDNASVSKTGAVALMLYPELWNPHDQNGPLSTNSPTQFRVVCDSSDPNTGVASFIRMQQFTSYGATPNVIPNSVLSPIQSGPTHLTKDLSSLTFTIPAGNRTLFLEPTLLVKKSSPAALQLSGTGWPDEVKPFVSNGGVLTSKPAGATLTPPPPNGHPYSAPSIGLGNGPAVGLCLGRAPVQYWDTTTGSNHVVGNILAYSTTGGSALTVQVQYKDAWNDYVTYDEKLPPNLVGTNLNVFVPEGNGLNAITNLVATGLDPRTERFGMMCMETINTVLDKGPFVFSYASPIGPPIDSNKMQIAIDNQNSPYNQGYFGLGLPQSPPVTTWAPNPPPGQLASGTVRVPAPGFFGNTSGWGVTTPSNSTVPLWIVGNNAAVRVGATNYRMLYADPDGVIRRASMGLWTSADQPPSGNGDIFDTPLEFPGNPMIPAAVKNNGQWRPMILNRPFRSVTELGYVSRDMPWKELDFTMGESGDTALLDVFTIAPSENTTHLVAGKVSIHTRQLPVLAAIYSGAYKDEEKALTPVPTGALPALSADEEMKIALAYQTWEQRSPLINLGELVGKWKRKGNNPSGDPDPTGLGYGIYGANSYAGMDYNVDYNLASSTGLTKAVFSADPQSSWYMTRMHGAVIRSLAAVGQSRVWNLMIDVVSQTGRFPTTAAGFNDFVAEGEQRYWVHVAIDRLTGEVLDRQLELVKE